MKAAKLENSDRLQRVDRLLNTGLEFSTREIAQFAHVCAVNSIIGELRENGRDIMCQRRGKHWFYRMAI